MIELTMACHKHCAQINNIHPSEYLSSDVMYDTNGNERFVTHLNVTLVNKSVHVVCIRPLKIKSIISKKKVLKYLNNTLIEMTSYRKYA
jgi:hypothetical protein